MKEANSVVNNICPVCRTEDFVTFPNKQVDREVKNLFVYCANKEKGCKWQGEVNYINNHLTKDEGCEYEDVVCRVGCGEVMYRQNLIEHIETKCPRRKVDCQYCQLRDEHQFIEGKHKEECVEHPISCPNKCEEAVSFPRKDLNDHKSKCPLEMIDCEYHSMGCEVRMTRQTQQEHSRKEMEYHLHLTKLKLDKTLAKLDETTAKLDEASCKLNITASELDNTNFAFHESKCELARVHSQLDETNSKLTGTQLELLSTKMKLSFMETKFDDKITFLETLLHQHNWLLQLHSATQVSSPGKEVIPVTFKMTGFTTKRKNKQEWLSNSFYTNTKGYRMCLQIDADGISSGKGTHCSMSLFLMRGEYDDGVHWPLNMKFKVTLLNQLSNDQHESHIFHFSQAVHLANVTHRVLHQDMAASGWGIPCFISHEDLTKVTPTQHFLKDDCIFVRVSRP